MLQCRTLSASNYSERIEEANGEHSWSLQGTQTPLTSKTSWHHLIAYALTLQEGIRKIKKEAGGTLRALLCLTDGSPDLAEGQGEADEGPVPLVVLPNGGHAHENEDQGLTDAAQHLHEILDGRVGCLGHVFFDILFHCHCTGCDSAKGKGSQGEATRPCPSLESPPYR